MERHHFFADQPGHDIRDISLTAIGRRYERLRIANPRADKVIYRSMASYGQFLPVVAAGDANGTVELHRRLHRRQHHGGQHRDPSAQESDSP